MIPSLPRRLKRRQSPIPFPDNAPYAPHGHQGLVSLLQIA